MKSQLSRASDRSVRRRQLLSLSAAAAAALLALAGARADATTITQVQLLGGSTSDGLALNTNGSTVLNAFYMDAQDSKTTAVFQGATFTPFQNSAYQDNGLTNSYSSEALPANVAVTYTGTTPPDFLPNNAVDTASNAGFTDTTDTTDNTALTNLVNKGLLFFSSTTLSGATADTATLTYSNLTPGDSYTVDLLLSCLGYGTKSYTVTANGVTSGTLSQTGKNDIYDVDISGLTPDINNDIVVSMTYASSSNGVLFNAAALSSVPEPASLGLMALASIGLLARRRRAQVEP